MKNQQGIGLIEVMVALMLLAVAMLGFSSMQMFAIKSTDESIMRTRAMTVVRGGSEMMRANLSAIESFKNTLNTGTPATGVTINSCMITSATSQVCDIKQLASRDALVLRDYATQNEVNIRLETCPGRLTGSQARQCFIVSWGVTAPAMADGKPANTSGYTMNCAKADGVYNMGAQCFIVEAY